MNSIEIRRVREGDEAALAFIQTESWKSAFAHILDADTLKRCADIGRSESMYRSLIKENKGSGYMLSVDGRPHCIAWWDASRDEDMEGAAELICIHSLPDNRRKGYGSAMMDRVISDMRAAGYKEAVLWVFTENTAARMFYEAKGFSASDKIRPILGAEEIRYVRTL